MNRYFAIILGFIFAAAAYGESSTPAELKGFDWNLAGQIAVQANGRIKPLDSFARETVSAICGKASYEGQHPVETYFRWMSDGDYWHGQPLLYLPKGKLRSELKLEDHTGSRFSFAEMQDARELMTLAMAGEDARAAGGKASFVQTKAAEFLDHMNVLSGVFTHEAPLFVPAAASADGENTWRSMPGVVAMFSDSALLDSNSKTVSDTLQTLTLAWAGLYNSVRENRGDIFNISARMFAEVQQKMLPQPVVFSKLAWEYWYNRLKPFWWARLLLALGFAGFLFSLRQGYERFKTAGLMGLAAGFVLYTAGMAMRAYVSGRAPWTNMYESLLAIGWAVVLISMLYELAKRERIFGMVGGILGAVILTIAQAAALDRGINVLVPALQSYWLNYHVIITLSGYACFAIAMGIGHGVLISGVRSKGEVTPSLSKLTKANLRIIQVGTLLLVTGILLGAVWANVSWGRFWGWDPKETWALICWFVYIALLHGRSAGWLGWRGLAAYSVGAFPIVIMTYYGVNYYLSGLHSYGAGTAPGVPWQILAYMVVEGAFLFWALGQLRGKVPVRAKKTRPVVADEVTGLNTKSTEVSS
ncbi:MAG TPA: cytochrome c biogenesis protein CcsA [bacterium]